MFGKLNKQMQDLMKQALEQETEDDDGGEPLDTAQSIADIQKAIEQLQPMKNMPGVDQTLKQLEGQLALLNQITAGQPGETEAEQAVMQIAQSLDETEAEQAGLQIAQSLGETEAEQTGMQIAQSLDEIQDVLRQQEQMKRQLAEQQAAQMKEGLQSLFGGLFGAAGIPAQPKRTAAAKPAQPKQTTAPRRAQTNTFTQITTGPLLKWIGGDRVEFGSYPQEADGSVKKILWRVLENKDGQLLLLSESVLAHRIWHGSPKKIPATYKAEDVAAGITQWEECELRQWLNGDFYSQAFTAAEQAVIAERLNTGNGAYRHRDYVPRKMHKMNLNRLTDDTYEKYEARGCRDTRDVVFLLNVEEAIQYFPKSEPVPDTVWIWNSARRAKATDYTLKIGFTSENPDYQNIRHVITPDEGWTWAGTSAKDGKLYFDYLIGGVPYWLRNLGTNNDAMNAAHASYHNSWAAYVCKMGGIFASGTSTVDMGKGVRPAILLNNQKAGR